MRSFVTLAPVAFLIAAHSTALATSEPDVVSTAGAKLAVPGLKGQLGNAPMSALNVSRTGRYVTFVSVASNLVKGLDPLPAKPQGFRRDRKLGKTVCFTLGTDGQIADEAIETVAASDNGRYVAYVTRANNLGTSHNGFSQVIWHDLKLDMRRIVSATSSGGLADHDCTAVWISGDGMSVAFVFKGSNLVPQSSGGVAQLYVGDIEGGWVEPVSFLGSTAGDVAATGANVDLSYDGRVIAFLTKASNLDGGPYDQNANFDVYVRDRDANTVSLISHTPSGIAANGPSSSCTISNDGRYVAFASAASDIVPQDQHVAYDCFVHDRVTHAVQYLENPSSPVNPTPSLLRMGMSDDGRYIVGLTGQYSLVDAGKSMYVGRRFDRLTSAVEQFEIAEPLDATKDDGYSDLRITGNGQKLLFTSNSPVLGIEIPYADQVFVQKL